MTMACALQGSCIAPNATKADPCTKWRIRTFFGAPLLLCALSSQTLAGQAVDVAGQAFAANCFSPFLTAPSAAEELTLSGTRHEFYDLRPFSSAAPSPVTGRAATPGTDRRCEVSFDGDKADTARNWILEGLTREGLADRIVAVPMHFAQQPGATFVAAAQLNPNRIAVVQAGTRPGPNGEETYMNVERLDPLDGSE